MASICTSSSEVPIGEYTNLHAWPEQTIRFFQRSDDEIIAYLQDHEYNVIVPGTLPGQIYDNLGSVAEKANWLINNAFFRCETNAQSQTLKFVPIALPNLRLIRGEKLSEISEETAPNPKPVLLPDGYRRIKADNEEDTVNRVMLYDTKAHCEYPIYGYSECKVNNLCQFANGFVFVVFSKSLAAFVDAEDDVKPISFERSQGFYSRDKLQPYYYAVEENVDGKVLLKIHYSENKNQNKWPQTVETWVINPITRNALKIVELKKSIKESAEKLDLYDDLAKLYREIQDSESKLGVFLAALGPAVRKDAMDIAQRFFWKARKLAHFNGQAEEEYLKHLDPKKHRQFIYQAILDQQKPIQRFLESLPPKTTKCKKRLIVGDGDFSFTYALIQKHKLTHTQLAKVITTSTIDKEFENNWIKGLKDLQVTPQFEVNAAKIGERFRGQRFHRIHWNRPFPPADPLKRDFVDILKDFVKGCSELQQSGDRIHIALQDVLHTRSVRVPLVTIFQYTTGQAQGEYQLIRKRRMNYDRYAQYIPVKSRLTRFGDTHKESYAHEFVFEKVGKRAHQKAFTIGQFTPFAKYPDDKRPYFKCSTDEESSDYYDYSSDEVMLEDSNPTNAIEEMDVPFDEDESCELLPQKRSGDALSGEGKRFKRLNPQ